MVLSLGLASAGTGTGLILVASHHVKNAGGSTSSGNVVSAGSFLQRKWLRQASPYVSTVNYRASISPLFQLVASPAEYQEVSNLVVAYNSEPLQMKTTGVRVYVSSTSTSSAFVAQPQELVPPNGGEGDWEQFQSISWNEFQWWMSHTYGENLVADIRAGDSVANVISSALSATGYGSVASPVISTLSLFSGGVANFIEFANGYCGNEPPFYVGVQYFVMPIHGC